MADDYSNVFSLPPEYQRQLQAQGLLGMGASLLNANRLRTKPGPTPGEALYTGALGMFKNQQDLEKLYSDQLKAQALVAESRGRAEERQQKLDQWKKYQKALGILTNPNTRIENGRVTSGPQSITPPSVAPAEDTSAGDPLDALASYTAQRESGGNALAVSETGNKGLMQLSDDLIKKYGVNNWQNKKQNYEAGKQHLADLADQYVNDPNGAEDLLMAYHAGSQNVADYRAGKASGVGPKTKAYASDPQALKLAQAVLDQKRAALRETQMPQVAPPAGSTEMPRVTPPVASAQPSAPPDVGGNRSAFYDLPYEQQVMIGLRMGIPLDVLKQFKPDKDSYQWVYDTQNKNSFLTTARKAMLYTRDPRYQKYESPHYVTSNNKTYAVYPNSWSMLFDATGGKPDLAKGETMIAKEAIKGPLGIDGKPDWVIPKGYRLQGAWVKNPDDGIPYYLASVPTKRGGDKYMPVKLATSQVEGVQQQGNVLIPGPHEQSNLYRTSQLNRQGIDEIGYMTNFIQHGMATGAAASMWRMWDRGTNELAQLVKQSPFTSPAQKDYARSLIDSVDKLRNLADVNLTTWMQTQKELLANRPEQWKALIEARSQLHSPNLPVAQVLETSLKVILANTLFSDQRIPVEALKDAGKMVKVTGFSGEDPASAVTKLLAVQDLLVRGIKQADEAAKTASSPEMFYRGDTVPKSMQPLFPDLQMKTPSDKIMMPGGTPDDPLNVLPK